MCRVRRRPVYAPEGPVRGGHHRDEAVVAIAPDMLAPLLRGMGDDEGFLDFWNLRNFSS
jgi:hypothetical protein